MSELTGTLLRLGCRDLLWVALLSGVAVLRCGLAPRRAASTASAGAAQSAVASARRVVVTGGPVKGTELPLGSTTVLVGRVAGAALRLDDDYTSTRHARIFPKGSEWWIQDLGSTNGTYVANEKISQPMRLRPGVQVRVGRSTLELRR